MSVHKVLQFTSKNATQPPEPPDMELTERVIKIEAKLDSILSAFATKEEMHKEFTQQTWKIFVFVTTFVTTISAAMVAAVYFIVKNVT